jgi:hypothetical protein
MFEPFGSSAPSSNTQVSECWQDAKTIAAGENYDSSKFRSVYSPSLRACLPVPSSPLLMVRHLYGEEWLQPPSDEGKLHGSGHACLPDDKG